MPIAIKLVSKTNGNVGRYPLPQLQMRNELFEDYLTRMLVRFSNDTDLVSIEYGADVPALIYSQERLLTEADMKWEKIIANGYVSVGNFRSSTAEKWQGYLSRAVQLSATTPIMWNGIQPITASELQAVGNAVGLFVQNAFNTHGQLEQGIASGAISTMEQIANPSAPFPAWPTNS